MMALDMRTSQRRQTVRSLVLAGIAGTMVFALSDPRAQAQQTAPAAPTATAEPKAAETPKKAKQKPKSKPAAQEAKAVKKDPAQAQQQIDAGIASLQAGKADLAVQQFTAALAGGSIPSGLMARAHYHRGLAYRKQSKPALAISDLTHALWLKNGLNETERADALQNRIAAYRDAGLPDQADAEGAGKSAGVKVAAAEPASASTSSGSTGSIPVARPTTNLAPAQDNTSSSSGGVSGFFDSLFGGSSNASPQPAVSAPAKPEPAVSAWSAGTEVKSASAPAAKPVRQAAVQPDQAPLPWQQNEKPVAATGKPAQVASAAAALAAPAQAHGRYMLQVAQLKTADEAQAVAARLKQQFVGELAGREASIVAVNAGGFGTLHRVTFGPFLDPAEWKAFCPKLLSAGHDCQALKQ